MGIPFDEIRVLLVQARTTRDMERQEQVCFLERCRIRPDQLVAANVVRDPLDVDLLRDADAFMIGGAGEFSATRDYPWMETLLDLVRAATDDEVPTFGSCWGHQIIARALGGTVIHDSIRAELGCHPVVLTEAGRTDHLFSNFPDAFLTNMGHHDRVAELPPSAVEIAYNESQRNQAFRLRGRPIYGTQFHSELDARRERERLIAYRDHYPELESDEAFDAVLESLAETTDVDHLLHDFLRAFVANTDGKASTPSS